MNSKLGLELIAYGIILAIISLFLQHLVSDQAQPLLITGLAGGALSVVWGVFANLGYRRRGWTILTLVIISFVLLSQTVMAWVGRSDAQAEPMPAKLLITLMFIFTVGLLVMIANADPKMLDPSRHNDIAS